MNIYLKLWPYFKKYWPRLLLVFFCIFLFATSNVYLMALVKDLSYDIERGNVGLFIYRICAGMVLVIVRSITMYGQNYNMAWIGHRMVYKLRMQIYEHLQKMSLDFYSRWKIGELISRSTNDLQVIQSTFIANIVELLPEAATFIGVLGYLMILNWKLLLMTFLTIPVFVFLINSFGKTMKKISRYNQRKMADISSILQETLNGINIIRAFATEDKEIDRYRKENEKSFWINTRADRLYNIQGPVLFVLQASMILLIFMVGGLQMINGSFTVGNFLAFVTGLALLVNPVTIFGKVHTRQQKANASMLRVFELLAIEPTIKQKDNAIDLKINGNLVFNNVSFKYSEKDDYVLKNINLNVRQGELIALVGMSGAGKTTLVNLIPRFYNINSGSITIDGVNINDLKLKTYRKQIGIVAQETILFSGTIRDNIAYACEEASMQEIIEAARSANAAEFIERFPSGYNTLVGEKGVRLSGGQRQRIAIARALLNNPRILILDEATSALDTESERLVQTALEKLMQGRTTFAIAHRLSTIQNADRILVLDKGEIIEEGTHEQLLQNSSIYKNLYEMQFKNKKLTVSE